MNYLPKLNEHSETSQPLISFKMSFASEGVLSELDVDASITILNIKGEGVRMIFWTGRILLYVGCMNLFYILQSKND